MNMSYDEFLRPFTEEEFEELFKVSGYSPISEQYCREQLASWMEYHKNEILEYYINLDIPIETMIEELTNNPDWNTLSVREEAWNTMKECSNIEVYIEEINNGASHEWAAAFANNANRGHDYEYQETFNEVNEKEPELAQQELERIISNIVDEKGVYYDKFLRNMIQQETIDFAIERSNKFDEEYKKLIKAGKDTAYSYKRSELSVSTDYAEEYCDIYSEAYAREILKGKSEDIADDLAYNEAEAFADTYFQRNWDYDKSKQYALFYTEFRQNGMEDKEAKESAEKETFKEEEGLYNSVYEDLIADGMDKHKAQKVAYEIVTGISQSENWSSDSHTHSNRESMLDMMYPNEDPTSEDFDDGFDIEDFYED